MDLPNEFDVIVLGTGMPESIVAAAFSRIGHKVLHLDKNEHYSGDWASFNLKGIEEWAKQHEGSVSSYGTLAKPDINEKDILEDGETLIDMPLNTTNFQQASFEYYVGDLQPEELSEPATAEPDSDKGEVTADNTETDSVDESSKENAVDDKSDGGASEEKLNENKEAVNEITKDIGELKTVDESAQKDDNKAGNSEKDTVKTDGKKQWTRSTIKDEWRKFNLDLSPKVLYSVGDMVELLIQSDIAKYCEFKTITQILTVTQGKVEKVPCSRADVFSSKSVSMLEKRMLMKFIQFCLEYENNVEQLGDILEKPFTEFLTSRKLTPTIKHYVQHSIAMATDSMTTRQGLTQMKKFLQSLGRYGNTAFLWSLYGSGELPQSFCRMCAVFGGVYCLRTTAASLIMGKQNSCTGIVTTDGQKIKCKWLIMQASYAPEAFNKETFQKTSAISRGILLTDKPLLMQEQQELSLMCLPCPDDGDRPIFLLELPSSSMSSPRGLYVNHLTRQGKDDVLPKDDLAYAVNTLFNSDPESTDQSKPSVVWSLFFSQFDQSVIQDSDHLPSNVVLMSGPGSELDIDQCVGEARAVFQKILPDEEFLPKAPNPEDIIYVDDNEAQVADGNSQSEFLTSDKDQSEETQVSDDNSQSNVLKDEEVGNEHGQSDVKKNSTDQLEELKVPVIIQDTSQSEVKKDSSDQMEEANVASDDRS
ncbi:rab proteins geranylgeranyltransferase component A 2-like isoform X2 [Mya arenaria]|uniref:rab proteins geranylgeranyltransferase component A 2-like isoform X2 n=1 Tax=Mya arenaria TaxID=6604 RepID=UPI0022E3857B|nr:rab proteins geranylgeranyltransferase component A 2-like isoform X2 [Mya arenaria]